MGLLEVLSTPDPIETGALNALNCNACDMISSQSFSHKRNAKCLVTDCNRCKGTSLRGLLALARIKGSVCVHIYIHIYIYIYIYIAAGRKF